jgi:hypothetical protein
MSRYRWPSARLQPGVWAMGAALSLGSYLAQSTGLRQPRPTPFGVERCLMGLGETRVQLRESPHGGRWLLTRARSPIDNSPIFAVASRLPATILQGLSWPGHGPNPRRLTPFEPSGTWLLEENGLRYLWSLTAAGWIDENHLWGEDAYPDWDQDWPPTIQWTLDLRTGRSTRSDDDQSDDEDQGFQYATSEEDDEPEPEVWRTLASALEELPLDRDGDWGYGSIVLGGKEYYLVDADGPAGGRRALYAVSDDPAPRILRLTGNARPLALSRDGQTLFFERNRALWRLDLRKPLPALLSEIRAPELPDPLAVR